MSARDHLSGQQFGRLPMTSNVVKKLNITFHDPKEAETPEGEHRLTLASEREEHQYPESMYHLPATEELHTHQEHVDKTGLRHYIDHPNNHEEWKEGEGYDAPRVYDHQGKLWVHEGHHRIIASRLRGDKSIPVHLWGTGE